MVNAVLFGSFIIMLILNVPIAVALGLSAALTLLYAGVPLSIIAINIYSGQAKFLLLAIPFFVLAGNIMAKAGISDRLIEFADACVGHKKGGIAIVSVIVACFFGALSGSGPATVAALGSILVPAMVDKDGFKPNFATTLLAAASSIAIVIPPSIAFIVYSSITGAAVGDLFMAGIIPGLVIAIGYMIVNGVYARKAGIPKSKFVGWKALGQDTLKALPALIMPVIIIGGILSGATTATEAGVVACVYSIIYGFIRKTMNTKHVWECFKYAVHGTTNCMIVVVFAGIFGTLATNYNLSKVVLAASQVFHGNPYLILIFISIILYIAGMFIDYNAAKLMLVPIFTPLIAAYGFDPIYFAMVCILTLDMGGMSPPVGLLMYISASITDTPLEKVVRNIFKFITVNYSVTLLVIFIPALVTWLPSLM